ncbi:MAG: hypothetical protein IT376_03260 [Polyangiaceae bacterium]|nr:hypothetical protein [Polyangiaceae bacterium]
MSSRAVPRPRCCCAGAAVLVAALAAPRVAAATELDAAGEVVFAASAVFTYGFESDEDAGAVDGGASLDGTDTDTALEGRRVLSVARFDGVDLPLPLTGERRSYRVSVWARGEVVGTVDVGFADADGGDFAVLYPTGRMTSDGWYELAAERVPIDGVRAERVGLGLFSLAGAEVDAIEVVPVGDAPESVSCAGVADPASCGAGQACEWGRCRNVDARLPALPPVAWRAELVRYLDARLRYLYGPLQNRERDLPRALTEIAAMDVATDAGAFWRHYRTAIQRLHDWHTRATDLSGFLVEDPRPIAACFVEGVADVPGGPPPATAGLDVLVSHVGEPNPLALARGDRLVEVDGLAPVQWTRSLVGRDADHWTASNPRTFAEDVSRLPELISRFARTVTVLRCDATAGTCAAAPETIEVHALPYAPDGTRASVGCDNRPFRHLPESPENHSRRATVSGLLVESDATEAIYGLEWSGLNVSGQPGDDGPPLRDAVALWRSSARGVVLDHRTGFGGTNLGPPILWEFVRTPFPLDLFRFRSTSDEARPSLAEGKAAFDALAAAGQVELAGGPSPRVDVPVALLLTLDGSASDWLPLGMKGAPRVRIFGPYETAGAFSTLFNFGWWFGVGYSIAVGDTLLHTGETINGQGVAPDEIVVPRQSDLLAGRDTVHAAALAWVRSELQP